MSEPPVKKLKSGEDFVELINDCYTLQFDRTDKTDTEVETLNLKAQQIRETVENVISSSDLQFGETRISARINWGKCLAVLIANGHHNLAATKILTERLSPGGGLF